MKLANLKFTKLGQAWRKSKVGKFYGKHRSTINIVAGIGLVTAGTVKACIDTPKFVLAIEKANDEIIDDIEDTDGEVVTNKPFIQKSLIKDAVCIYGLDALMFGIGIAAICNGHRVDLKDNAMLASALAAQKKQMDSYRDNIISVYGTEGDEVGLYGSTRSEVEVTNADGTIENKKMRTVDKNKCLNSVIIFNEESAPAAYERPSGVNAYSNRDDSNLMYLNVKEQCWNNSFAGLEKVYLYEVLVDMGFDRKWIDEVIPNSRNIGWLWDDSSDSNYIQLNAHMVVDAETRERTIVIEPNCRWIEGLKINSSSHKAKKEAAQKYIDKCGRVII